MVGADHPFFAFEAVTQVTVVDVAVMAVETAITWTQTLRWSQPPCQKIYLIPGQQPQIAPMKLQLCSKTSPATYFGPGASRWWPGPTARFRARDDRAGFFDGRGGLVHVLCIAHTSPVERCHPFCNPALVPAHWAVFCFDMKHSNEDLCSLVKQMMVSVTSVSTLEHRILWLRSRLVIPQHLLSFS